MCVFRVLEERSGSHQGVAGCAEVNEPLCGSSYPVCSLCHTTKKNSLMSSVFHQLDRFSTYSMLAP